MKDMPKSVSNRTQSRKYIQIYHIFIADGDHYYILDEIKQRG